MRSTDLAGKRVAIYGFGREGQTALRVLRERARPASIVVIDDRSVEPTGATFIPGPPPDDVWATIDVLIRSPGVSIHRPAVVAARAAGVAVTTLTSLWLADHPDVVTVGVTGTKGKSTTATLLCRMLAAAGMRSALRGNIGRPLYDPEEPEDGLDVIVLELSSHQLADLTGRLAVGIVTSLGVDHLDWHGDAAAYHAAKLRLVDLCEGQMFVSPDHPALIDLITAARARPTRSPAAYHARDGRLARGDRVIGKRRFLPLPGPRALENACAAAAAAEFLGVDPADVARVVDTFEGLPHRLECIGEGNGRLFVDDGLASNPSATMAALATFVDRGVQLLFGGADRGVDLEPLVAAVADRDPVCRIHAFGPCGARLAGRTERRVQLSESLEDAVRAAWRASCPGDVILLSPGAPSFDAYRDHAARSQAFRNACAPLILSGANGAGFGPAVPEGASDTPCPSSIGPS